MAVKEFEDLLIWKLSRELYAKTRKVLANKESRDFLISHILRTCISISSNIVEGFERGGDKEFCRFLCISKGSCGEFRSQLYVLSDFNLVSPKEHEELFVLSKKVSGSISNLIKYLKK